MEKIIIAKKYRLLQKLGSGSFGQIYQCQDVETKKKLAIKLQEKKKQGQSQLIYQSKIYQILQGTNGVCKMYECGLEGEYNFLVLQKLGQSLQDLFQISDKKFNYKTVLMIADQIISRIQFLHMKGFVHRDIKSSNFMIGINEKKNTIYIIDFGLAKRYKDFKTSEHIKQKGGKSLVGTARYASIASHEGYQQCRRDDLQSIGYLLIYFMKGKLPWQGIKSKTKAQKFDKIGQIKKQMPLQKLCQGLSNEFKDYMKYIRNLQFTEQPDYNYVRKLFKQKFILNNFQYDEFQWAKSNNKNLQKSEKVKIQKKQKKIT